MGIISGLIIYTLFCTIDYRTLMRWGYFCYIGVVGLLIFTLIKGSIGMGAQRWINLGFIKLQPSELTKLLFPAFATYYFYTQKDMIDTSWSNMWPVLATLGCSFILILKQPDLGTALILLFSSLLFLWLLGVHTKFFIIGALTVLSLTPVLWLGLKPYQKKRITVFLGYGDSKKERYHIEQSKIAIGSGGLTGKGFLHGTQNKLLFLPESRTDFIFAVICEEWGFIGALFILFLYFMLFARLIFITRTIKSPLIQLFAISIVMHIIISAIINIGMVIGLLPVVGIPLPMISYGISYLWTTFASLGWFNSIAMRRFYMSIQQQ